MCVCVNMSLCVSACIRGWVYSETSDSGPSKKGHNIKDLSTRDTARGPKNYLPYSFNTLTTSEKRTTSLQRTKLVNLYCPQSVP